MKRVDRMLLVAGIAFVAACAAAYGDEATPGASAESPPQSEQPAAEPIPDRWRLLQPVRRWWDPYNQNVLKGDYPIYGDAIFLRLTGASKSVFEARAAPLASAASARDPGSFNFFGSNNSLLFDEKLGVRAEVFKGSTAFRPYDWQLVIEGVGNANHLSVGENGAVSPDVRDGASRTTTGLALQEAALELHLADLSARYDFVALKLGRQPFNSDFRSLIFSDVNQGVRLFGNADGNRYQYNVVYLYPAEKDTNSELNTFSLRNQQLLIANLYVQDFLLLGYQTELSFHYDHDAGSDAGLVYDNQGFLVRPDPVGSAQPHDVNAYYLGWAGEGHIGRINLSHAFYEVLGKDSHNPIAGRSVDINAQMAFLELSFDHDWMRYQSGVLWASGDGNPRDNQARGFDSILDNPKVFGGDLSFWQRQTIRITDRGGVGLVQRNSLLPDLRSSKLQGQSNFVNPGLLMFNLGATAELTPRLRAIANANYLRFDNTAALELLLKQPGIGHDLGLDFSLGVEYRPWLNNNVIVRVFGAVFQPLDGFTDIYQSTTLYQAGTEVVLVY